MCSRIVHVYVCPCENICLNFMDIYSIQSIIIMINNYCLEITFTLENLMFLQMNLTKT